ncbi:MAG: hypothetical protein WED00_09850 [Aquisalimonadaceae bacterium]
MNYFNEWRWATFRYFPIFILVFVAGVISIASAVATIAFGHFSHFPAQTVGVPFVAGLSLMSVVLTALNVLALRGNAISIILFQTLFLLILVILVASILQVEFSIIIATGLVSSVIGLSAARSRRYEELIEYYARILRENS